MYLLQAKTRYCSLEQHFTSFVDANTKAKMLATQGFLTSIIYVKG